MTAIGTFAFHIREKILVKIEQFWKSLNCHINMMVFMSFNESQEKFIGPCKEELLIKNFEYLTPELSHPIGLHQLKLHEELTIMLR